jgi:plasmid replication initiation protein
MGNELVVKDNALTQASYSLGLVEARLILLAIVEARDTGLGVTSETYLEIQATHYAEKFNVTRQTAYKSLGDAALTLFNRQVTLHDTYKGKPDRQIVRWVSGISYVDELGLVRIRFSPDVIPLITRLEENFTWYELEQVAGLKSAYAVRLYELLIQWRTTGKTPEFKLEEFRNQMGLSTGDYPRIDNLKSKVLDLAVEQINEHTDIIVTYEQVKTGRAITGFTFKFKQKAKPETPKINAIKLDSPKKQNPFKGIDDMELFLKKHQQGVESMEETHKRLLKEAENGTFTMSPTD